MPANPTVTSARLGQRSLPWEDRSYWPSWPWPVRASRPPAWGPQPAVWAQPPMHEAQLNKPPVSAACVLLVETWRLRTRTMVLLLLKTSYLLSSSKAHGHQGPHPWLTQLPVGPLGRPRPPQPKQRGGLHSGPRIRRGAWQHGQGSGLNHPQDWGSLAVWIPADARAGQAARPFSASTNGRDSAWPSRQQHPRGLLFGS